MSEEIIITKAPVGNTCRLIINGKNTGYCVIYHDNTYYLVPHLAKEGAMGGAVLIAIAEKFNELEKEKENE